MVDFNQIKILFEDQHLIVLSKPTNLLSQGDSSGEVSLVDLLRTHFGRHYVGLIHRLDRNTTGLMVIAKRSKSADRLSTQLKDGTLVREYHAILEGKLEGEHMWQHYLLKNEENNTVKVVKSNTPKAKAATLKVLCIKNFIHPTTHSELTLARFQLETGRSHQIRAQSAAMHYPLIGDPKYGGAKNLALFPRPALHSCFLSFEHPMSRQILTFHDDFPDDFKMTFLSAFQQSLNT